MTQIARKGKLYQLQVLIDLSCFIISHIPAYACPTTSISTRLIYFVNASHNAFGEGMGAALSFSKHHHYLPHALTTRAI
jgi:hypothetical protein